MGWLVVLALKHHGTEHGDDRGGLEGVEGGSTESTRDGVLPVLFLALIGEPGVPRTTSWAYWIASVAQNQCLGHIT